MGVIFPKQLLRVPLPQNLRSFLLIFTVTDPLTRETCRRPMPSGGHCMKAQQSQAGGLIEVDHFIILYQAVL